MGEKSSKSGNVSSVEGFSIIELLVTLGLVTFVMVAVLTLFERTSQISRSQMHISDLQQSLRFAQMDVTRYVRMAGRGGLPQELAIVVRNNAGASDRVGDATSKDILDRTDLLTVRGVFNSPLYQVNPAPGVLVVNQGSSVQGSLTLTNPSPTGVPQDLTALGKAITDGRPEAILIVSGQGDTTWAVVQLDPSASNTSNLPASVTIGFKSMAHLDALSTGGTFQPTLVTASHVGILEELRFYIEEDYEPASGGDLTPRFSRERFYPNSDVIHAESAGRLADNLVDFQVALGYDTNGDGIITESDPPDAADEWVGNFEGDAALTGTLTQLRITTLARTDRRSRNYVARPIATIEDRSYNEPALPTVRSEARERMYPRQLLTGIVELRNL